MPGVEGEEGSSMTGVGDGGSMSVRRVPSLPGGGASAELSAVSWQFAVQRLVRSAMERV